MTAEGSKPAVVAVSTMEMFIHAVGLESVAQMVEIMSYFMIFVSILVFVLLFLLKAPYGRYSNTNVFGFGLGVKVAWFLQELPSFGVPSVIMFSHPAPFINRILLSMFILHYFQRTFFFSLSIRGGKVTPFVPFFLALVFCLYNGFMQGSYLIHVGSYPDDWLTSPQFFLGLLIFFFGMFINIWSDYILRNLRKPGETGYKIPRGGMFEYVSGANFFGEIVEWMGFSIACWSLPSLAFAIFTFSNIGQRALHHHKWYLEKFEDYPKHRKAFIPFLL